MDIDVDTHISICGNSQVLQATTLTLYKAASKYHFAATVGAWGQLRQIVGAVLIAKQPRMRPRGVVTQTDRNDIEDSSFFPSVLRQYLSQ